MTHYRARMQHNASTIRKLAQTQYDTFRYGRKLINILLSVGLILFGLYGDQTMITPMIALFAGCFLLANLNAVPRSRANELLKQIGDNFPKSDYRFGDDGFTFHAEAEKVLYKDLIRLVEDRQYLYLYVNEQSAYMVDKATVNNGGPERLKTDLALETGLKWSRATTLLNFRLKDLFPKKEKEYKGPRLQ